MRRSLLFKALLVCTLGIVHLSSPTPAVASTSNSFCGGVCDDRCPSPFDWDEICHSICGHTSMGWCPSTYGEALCSPWDVMVACGIGTVE